jgi:Protein of unknown function (DUF2934)
MPKPKTSKPVTPRKRSKTASDAVIPATHPDPEAVAMRAYELFMRRGGVHGNDWADWLAAEQELAGGAGSPASQSADYAG